MPRDKGLQELMEHVLESIEFLSKDGIEGWGLYTIAEDGVYEPHGGFGGTLIISGATYGCTSETCGHVSHDPAAPVVKWLPPEGSRLVHLGGETTSDGAERDYYAVVLENGVLFAERYEPPHRHARLRFIEAAHVPKWALARLADQR